MTSKINSNKHIKANSYKELLDIVTKNPNSSKEIRLKNITICFDLDFNKFLRVGKFAKVINNDDVDPMIETTHLIVLDNVSCNKIDFTNIVFENSICIYGIEDQTMIHNMTFYGCRINCPQNISDPVALEISNVKVLNQLILENCIFNSFVLFFSIKLNRKKNINIIDCVFRQSVRFEDVLLYPNSILNICGEKALFAQDLMFYNCKIAGCLDIRSEIVESLRLYKINYQIDKEYHVGFLSLQDVFIGKALRFLNCNVNTIDIVNTQINDVYEYGLNYRALKTDASVVFRAAAIKNNNEFLIQKYTATVYDQRLKEGLSKLKIGVLRKKKNTPIEILKELFKKFIWEPIVLLISSFSTGERLLLWLNKYSNDYNRSWIRGIWFTAMTALLFYFVLNSFGLVKPVFIVNYRFENFKVVSEGYLSLIDVFNLSGTNFEFQTNTLGKYIIFFARVFIVYGIYQTIYAFYKYKK